MSRLSLEGLHPQPAQVWGNIRLVPLTREAPVEHVRMALRSYSDEQWFSDVSIGDRSHYLGYIPHGIVMQWTPDGEPLAAVDTRIGAKEMRRKGPIVQLDRMARGFGRNALRLLPLHFAMEGYLALHFGGPDLADQFWSKKALRDGLSPRTERVVPGDRVPGLQEALRVFERHIGQCGLLVFIGDHLASGLVVGHPDDYAALHDAVITDFFGNLFAQWGWALRDVPSFDVGLEGTTLDAIRSSLDSARRGWADFSRTMAGGLFERPMTVDTVRRAGTGRLVRFTTNFEGHAVDGEHIGEALLDGDGAVIYLKSYRLDRGQTRRGHLLTRLAECEWDPRRLAEEQGHADVKRIIGDLDSAGLGWMVRNDWRHTTFR